MTTRRSMVDYRRAVKKDSLLFDNTELLLKKTSLIAEEDTHTIATLQYRIVNFDAAEITLFNPGKSTDTIELLSGFIDEIMYWNPYFKHIDISVLSKDDLIEFKRRSSHYFAANHLMTGSNIEVIKVQNKRYCSRTINC